MHGCGGCLQTAVREESQTLLRVCQLRKREEAGLHSRVLPEEDLAPTASTFLLSQSIYEQSELHESLLHLSNAAKAQ